MKDIQARWNKIVELTEDNDKNLQGLRNTIFIDCQNSKYNLFSELRYSYYLIRTLFAKTIKINHETRKKIVFYFPFNSTANLKNLINVYSELGNNYSEIFVIYTKSIDASFFNNDKLLKEDLVKILKHNRRFIILIKAIKLFHKLNTNHNNKFIATKLSPIKYISSIFDILASREAMDILHCNLKFDKLISTSDFFPIDYGIYTSANNQRVKTYMIQHGILGISHTPFTSNYIFTWNTYSEKQLLTCGIHKNQIIISGMPSSDGIFRNNNYLGVPQIIGEKVKLLILSDSHASTIYPDVYKKYFELLDSLTENSINLEIIIKLHPAESENAYEKYSNKINILNKEDDLITAIQECDIVASIWSTAALEAMALHKITLILKVSKSVEQYAWWPNHGGGKFVSNTEEILALIKTLPNSEILNKQEIFIKEYFPNKGIAARFIAKELEKQF